MDKEITAENSYDMIIVGSGNGACGFLCKYMQQCDPHEKILVLEAGKDFLETSDITHQNNWTQSYGEEQIFKLHNAQTPDGTPIISGWACTMGGGGSINYAMIHESSAWLMNHFGHKEDYWDGLKQELNHHLQCLDPLKQPTELTQYLLRTATVTGFNRENPDHYIENIPSYHDLPQDKVNQLYVFSTQFNVFGQRTHSGVSLVNWFDSPIELKTQCRVTQLEFVSVETGGYRCQAVHGKYTDQEEIEHIERFCLKETGKVILCAGAATPRLLMPYRDLLNNLAIGQQASDHIAIPLGIYLLNKKLKPTASGKIRQNFHLTSRDNYAPIFATTVWQPDEKDGLGQATVCTAEFFVGNLEKLWYFVSHIYLAFLLPNWLKSRIIRQPRLFNCYKGTVRLIIKKLNFVFNLWEDTHLITAIIKFNPAKEGQYSPDNNQIHLNFFQPEATNSSFNQDRQVAERVISQQLLPLMTRFGKKPPWFIRFIFRRFGIPFEPDQVGQYLERYSQKYLLSQQHMAGGCLVDKAVHKGLDDAQQTGKVKGSANVYVADLSASPLPRVSTQMTAYLIGMHVATQLRKDACPTNKV